MNKCLALGILGSLFLFACSRGITSDMRVESLRCEYLENPLGIHETLPRLSWKLVSSARGQKQTAYRILVASSQVLLEKNQGDLWDTGRISGDHTNQIPYAGKPLVSRTLVFWKVQSWDVSGQATEFSAPAFWSMGFLNPSEWKAVWIKADRGPGEEEPEPLAPGPPPPYFRKSFLWEPPVEKALLYITARGLFEVRLNGQRITEDLYAPEWTDYHQRLQYRTYDVSSLLRSGENVLAAIVADGWYSGYVGWRKFRGNYGLENSLLAQLEIGHPDGTSTKVLSDETWLWSEGPILSADLLMGQHQDARRSLPGWDSPGFDDAAWKPVQKALPAKAQLVAQPAPPVRIFQYITPKTVNEPLPGVFVFDLGQNIAGWARLQVQGQSGNTIRLRYAERLNPDGTIYTENLRDATATDSYICRGGETEIFNPRFTFHGFQYIEITGYPGTPTIDDVTGCAVATDCPETGTFLCSHPMVNQLYSNLVWSQRANYLSVPTDCPQRDERLGWMGDAQIFVRTGSFNQDVAAFFNKWMQDVVDAQSEAGAFPDFAPRLDDKVLQGFEAAPAWGDAGVIVPWTIYRVYGDLRLIEKHWDAMERWMDFLRLSNPNLIRTKNVGNNYGDWLSIQADTPKDLLATAFWAYDARLMAAMAEVTGRSTKVKTYQDLFEDIRNVFQTEFISADGRVKGETQTGYVLALGMDLLPEGLRSQAAEHLVADLEMRGKHLSTGFVGCGFLNPVLTEAGYSDMAYQVLLQDSFPSWGYSIQQGATSIWERWDGWTVERGFQDPGMNSFNHYAFGAIGEWLFRYVAGIDLDPHIPGYKRFVIRPFIEKNLTHARAEYDSIQGRIISEWKLDSGEMSMTVTIPVNTRAEIHIPNTEKSQIKESGFSLEQARGVVFLRQEKDRTICQLDSGTYTFTFPWKPEG